MLSSGLAARCRNARSGSYRRLEAARKATVPAGDACRPGNAGYPDVMPDVPGVRRGPFSHLAGTVRSRRGLAEARWLTLPGNVRGALWIVLASALFSVMSAMVKLVGARLDSLEIVGESCRERVCQVVEISVCAVSFKKKAI